MKKIIYSGAILELPAWSQEDYLLWNNQTVIDINKLTIPNEFDDLDTWCKAIGSSEYEQTYLNTHPNVVRKKINEMLRLNLIEIIK